MRKSQYVWNKWWFNLTLCSYFRGLFGQMKFITGLVLTFVLWITSITTVIPYLINLDYNYQNKSCDENWNSDSSRNGYTMSLFFLDYLLPLIAMIVLSLLVWGKLQRWWMRKSYIKWLSNDCPKSAAKAATAINLNKNQTARWTNQNYQKSSVTCSKREKTESRVMRLVLVFLFTGWENWCEILRPITKGAIAINLNYFWQSFENCYITLVLVTWQRPCLIS